MNRPIRVLHDVPPLATLLEREASGAGSVLPTELKVPPHYLERALFRPLRAMCERPSKRFRARLAALAYDIAGGRGPAPEVLTAIVEAYHLGSLIVDDIEDGSLERRGEPALHCQVGLPLALNAGNWLYFWPGVLLENAGFSAQLQLQLRTAIDRAVLRCHYGQALDLSVRVTELSRREVRDLVYAVSRLKTGSLMELSAELGALAAGADPAEVAALGRAGCDLGVALQMLDDLTSVTSEHRRHKAREDIEGARPTWAWVWLSEVTDEANYRRLRARADLKASGEPAVEDVAARLSRAIAEPGRAEVRACLHRTLEALERDLGPRRGLAGLRAEIARLERYDG